MSDKAQRRTSPGPAHAATQLQDLIRDELAERDAYLALARHARGQTAAVLRQLAREEAGHARRLSALYFARTGKRAAAEARPADPPGQLADALRERYRIETAGASLYARTAEAEPDARALYEQLACDERHHAQRVLTLLERLL